MKGNGPKEASSPANSAAPVGVVSSTDWPVPWTGAPANSRTTAGAGLGSTPCAPRTVPVPTATGLAYTEATPSDSRARQVPMTSIRASRPPTSWKWTTSGLVPWTRPSAAARQAKTFCARRRARSGSPVALSTRARMVPQVRSAKSWAGSTSTIIRVAARPDRVVFSVSMCQPPTGRAPRPAVTSSRSAPASSRLAKAMSPAIPEKQCHQATVVNGAPRGCGLRPRRRRSRCRCPPHTGRERNSPAWREGR